MIKNSLLYSKYSYRMSRTLGLWYIRPTTYLWLFCSYAQRLSIIVFLVTSSFHDLLQFLLYGSKFEAWHLPKIYFCKKFSNLRSKASNFVFTSSIYLFTLIKNIFNTTSIWLPWPTFTSAAMAAITAWTPKRISRRTSNFSQRKQRNIRLHVASRSVFTLLLELRLCRKWSIMPSRLGIRRSLTSPTFLRRRMFFALPSVSVTQLSLSWFFTNTPINSRRHYSIRKIFQTSNTQTHPV